MKTLLTDTDKSVINLRLCILCSVWSTEGDVDNPAPHYRHTMHTKHTTDIRCTQNKQYKHSVGNMRNSALNTPFGTVPSRDRNRTELEPISFSKTNRTQTVWQTKPNCQTGQTEQNPNFMQWVRCPSLVPSQTITTTTSCTRF